MTRDKIAQEIASTQNLVRWDIENLSLAGLDFSGVNMEKAKVINCRLVNADFQGANLSGALFDRCRFKNNRFDEADLRGTRFNKCSGLTPDQIASLEQAGAVVEKPVGRFGPFLAVFAVLALATVLFFVAGGYEILPGRNADQTPVVEASPTPVPTADLEAQVEQAVAAGKYGQAVELLDELVERHPQNNDYLLPYIRALVKADRHDTVTETVEKFLTLDMPDDQRVQARMLLAESQIRRGETTNGVALYDKLLDEYKEDALTKRAVLMNKGTVLWQAGDYPTALKVFNQLLKASARDQQAGVWMNIAMVHHDAGNTAKEIAAYRRAINDKKAPSVVRIGAKIKLALCELNAGHIEKAQKMIEQAAAANADPGQVLDALHKVALAYVAKNEKEKAQAIYEKAIILLAANNTALNNARVHLANLLMEDEQIEQALALYRQVAAESPDPAQKQWAAETAEEIAGRIVTPTPE